MVYVVEELFLLKIKYPISLLSKFEKKANLQSYKVPAWTRMAVFFFRIDSLATNASSIDHVFSSGENFALFRPATQSSMWEDYVATKAVDGNVVDDSSCAITNTGDYKPWWKVQLAYPIWVSHMELTNRVPAGGFYTLSTHTHTYIYI